MQGQSTYVFYANKGQLHTLLVVGPYMQKTKTTVGDVVHRMSADDVDKLSLRFRCFSWGWRSCRRRYGRRRLRYDR